nr:hypothetical protein [Tanacetum cinerariifolium]
MDVAAMKHMTLNFSKLDKFKGVDFIRWQKKMHFFLSSMNVVYVLTTPIPEDGGDDETMEQIRKKNKWDNDDYICRELWNSLEADYMTEDASSKKFLVSIFTNYKMTDLRPVMKQYNELLGILGRFTQHKINMNEAIQVSCIIDKLLPSWKDFKHTLKHKKEELNLVELGSHLRIEESLKTKKKPNLNHLRVWGCRVVVRLPDPKLKTLGERGIECIFVGYVEHSKAFRFYVIEPNDSVAINSIIESSDAIFDENRFSSVPRPSQRSQINATEDIGGLVVPEKVTDEVIQQLEPEHGKIKRHRTPKDFGPEFQLYLIEGTRDEVSDQHSYCFNAEDDPMTFDEAIKSHDVAFWKEVINDKIDSIMGNNTWVLVDLPLGCKQIFKRKLKMDVKTTFLNGNLDEEAPKQWHQKFDEVVLSNGYLLNQADKCVYRNFDETGIFVIKVLYEEHGGGADVILGIRIKHESNEITISQSHYIEKALKKFNYFNCTPVSTPMDTSEKLMSNNGKLSRYTSNPDTQHWQAIQRVLKYLKKTMDYRLTYTGYPSVLEGYTNESWISNTEKNSSTSGWVFLLGGGAISWASKKQTCITGSTMEYEFVALAAAGKKAEWLKNLLLEILLWSKPIASISIRCDSAATMAKAYSQMYNGKSRHLGVRHNMIHEQITNEVISIEFEVSTKLS